MVSSPSRSLGWDDVAGLEHAKSVVQEEVVWPLLRPDLFVGVRAAAKGLLLFGPPGTGKTLIGRAIASLAGATFISISAASLTSKWIGEGESLVRALFAVAAHLSPAVVFIDEIDALMASRGQEGEHEASRRIKVELLVQMEGVVSGDHGGGRVVLVGATNRPSDLDEGVRRRLAKHLYVPLPDAKARGQLLATALRRLEAIGTAGGPPHTLTERDLEAVVRRTEGYSGSDLRNLLAEACRQPLRETVRLLEAEAARGRQGEAAGPPGGAAVALALGAIKAVRPVSLADFRSAVRQVRASVAPADVACHEAWDARYGSRPSAASGEGGAELESKKGW